MTPVQRFTPAVRIGCSGWQYRHWRGNFYPAELATAQWLERYAAVFDTVEVNNTFYRLPEAPTFGAWRRRVPTGFLFAVKASRYLTHMKKLKDPRDPLARLFTRARRLGPALGPVLYQLPPRWPVDLERLETFLAALPPGYRHAIEFRDATWYRDSVFGLLDRFGVALCLHDMAGSASERLAVGPFVYVRFHGTSKYSGSYPDAALQEWATWLTQRIHEGTPIFAYFNNDIGGHAPRDAVRLRQMIQGQVGRVARRGLGGSGGSVDRVGRRRG